MGEKGNKFMYHYIKDKEFLSKLHSTCADIVNQLVVEINKDSVIKVSAYLVGSGAKKLITQNGDQEVDLDYNLEIKRTTLNNCRDIKNYIMDMFDVVLERNGWGNCQDSTSVISTEYREFKQGNRTGFKVDIAIVKKDYTGWQRLIHDKTGFVAMDRYYWNQAPNSRDLEDRVKWIKNNNYWADVRIVYLEKKNMYLSRQDEENHPSFNVYIETINELFMRLG